jgi:plastocyanin
MPVSLWETRAGTPDRYYYVDAMIKTAFGVLAFVVLPRLAPAQETGRIDGIASISSRLTTPRLRVRVYDEAGTPPADTATDSPFANVVLYLSSTTPLHGRAQAGTPVPAMRQHGERFVPHVLPVLAGTSVEFPNDDALYHNVFSLSRTRAFDLGRYPRGSSKTIVFTTPGVVQVFCHIHADMSGTILVLDNPFFVIPGADGRFSLEGVPPGDYQLIAWHERIRPLSTPIHVQAGRTTTLNLRIPLPDAPEIPR